MPRILAIDWDRLEARAVLLSAGPTGSAISGAWAVSLATADGVSLSPREIGNRLAAALGDALGNKATTLIAVGREQVQMVLLSLPPAPLEELPEMVRFQAERSFTSLGDDAALDFIPLTGDATTQHQVLAAALSGNGMADVRQLGAALEVVPDRITLRATAAAAFAARKLSAGASDVSLIVNRLSDEADLTVLVGDQVVLVRTVRIPDRSEAAGRTRALQGEIRRTIAAARQQMGELPVGRVVLCGSSADASEAATLADELGLTVDVFDVIDNSPAGLAKSSASTDSLPRFAAVMGMALGEADRRAPVVDFLNVRRRIESKKFTRQHALMAVTAALVVLSLGLMLWKKSHDKTARLASLNVETAAKQAQFKQLQLDKTVAQADGIRRWLATDINWLDELDRLSQQWRPEPLDSKKYAAAADAVITQLIMLRPPGNDAAGGRMTLQAVARNAQTVATIESRLRDERHDVDNAGGRTDNSVPGYLWSFPLTIEVTAAPAKDAAP